MGMAWLNLVNFKVEIIRLIGGGANTEAALYSKRWPETVEYDFKASKSGDSLLNQVRFVH
jgi:hypothetical protein